jgi:hypothetical protein
MLPWGKQSCYILKHLSCLGVILGIDDHMAQVFDEGGIMAMNQEEGRPESS